MQEERISIIGVPCSTDPSVPLEPLTGGPLLKFTIQQEDLQNALGLVANVVPGKTTMPILTCVLLEAEDDRLTVSATNLDMSVTTGTGNVNVKSGGRLAVPATKFIPFVRSLSAGEVQITEKGGRVNIVSGKASLSESSMNAEEFPALPALDGDKGLEVETGDLTRMIKSTAYAVSRDETRPALMGILWELKPTALTMVATDAHRLARITRKADWGIKDVTTLITDTQGLLQFVRLAEGCEKSEVFFNDNQLSFRMGETTLHTRLLEGPFPDYTAVIPKANNMTMTIDREAFINAVRRVSITADRVTSQIRLGIENGRLELSATGTDGSRAEDELPVSYDGEAMEIGFNYNYLLDVLKNIVADSVELSMKDPQSAALVSPAEAGADDDDLLCLLMPLRLTSD